MHHRIPRSTARALLALACLAIAVGSGRPEAAQAKPKLSAEIRKALDEGGAPAAERRFQAIYPGQKDRYELDAQALTALAGEAMQKGDAQTAQVIMQMAFTVLQDDPALAAPGARERPPREREATPPSPAHPAGPVDFGPPRRDLSRFHGLYGDRTPSKRSVFVRETCDGHLQLGSLWGDVSPWTMRSVSDTEFVQGFVPPYQQTPAIRLAFEVGPDGRAVAVRHPLTGEPVTAPRVGPLPEDWPERDCSGGR